MDYSAVYPNTSSTFAEAVKVFATTTCILGQCFRESDYVKDGSIFDYIIIGGGSAGCVLANRLTEIHDAKVLLVEFGTDPPLQSWVPGLSGELFNTEHILIYKAENDHISSQYLTNKSVSVHIGKMLGGGSSANTMMFFRGNKNDYNKWAAEGIEGWDYESILPYFKKLERESDVTTLAIPNNLAYRGTNGPVKLTKPLKNSYDLDIIKQAFTEFNMTFNPDLNGRDQMGFGVPNKSIWDGIRQSTAVAYLAPIQNRENLYILKEALATKILINEFSKMAYGVQVKAKYGNVTFYTKPPKGEVIVSAGAIKSPQLLMLSGIGPREHLEKLKIKVIADLPVGKNLQEHTFLPFYISGMFGGDQNATDESGQYSQYFFNRTGSLTNSDSGYINFYSVENNSYPDVQIYPSLLRRASNSSSYCDFFGIDQGFCRQVTEIASTKDILNLQLSVMNVTSRGRILLNTTDSEAPPLIFTGFGSSEEDLEKVALTVEKLSQIVNVPILKRLQAQVEYIDVPGCEKFVPFSKKYWKCYYLNLANSIYHWSGTCKMGSKSHKSTVVDNNLKVLSIDNLRVVDASIMPTVVSSNTNNPVIAIAEKAADLIKEHRSKN